MFEDDLAKIRAGADAPVLKDGDGHGSKLHEGKIFDAAEQFLAGHMADVPAGVLVDELLGVVQRILHKE